MKNAFRTLFLSGLCGIVSLTAMLAVSHPAYALRDSKPIATDRRIRTVVYNDNEIFKVEHPLKIL